MSTITGQLQEVSRLRHDPANRSSVLRLELAATQDIFERDAREYTDASTTRVFNRLAETAAEAIERGDVPEAERAIREMDGILYSGLWQNPSYIVRVFKTIAGQPYRAIDQELHARLVDEGAKATASNEMGALMDVIHRMYGNQVDFGGDPIAKAAIAGISRG